MGDIPVIVRLVLEDGTEMWRPARANRWTRTQVLVIWLNDPQNPWSQQTSWLATADVTQAVVGSDDTLTPIWNSLPHGRPGKAP